MCPWGSNRAFLGLALEHVFSTSLIGFWGMCVSPHGVGGVWRQGAHNQDMTHTWVPGSRASLWVSIYRWFSRSAQYRLAFGFDIAWQDKIPLGTHQGANLERDTGCHVPTSRSPAESCSWEGKGEECTPSGGSQSASQIEKGEDPTSSGRGGKSAVASSQLPHGKWSDR